MSIPWWIEWALPADMRRELRRPMREYQERERQRADAKQAEKRRAESVEFLDAVFAGHLPLIERTFPFRFYCIERDRLMGHGRTTREDLESLQDKIVKRGEVASLLAYYEQHFPPGSPQYRELPLDAKLEQLDEETPLVPYLDSLQRLSIRLQQTVAKHKAAANASADAPAAMSDYRKQMRVAYEAIRNRVEQQAFPGASQTVMHEEVNNQWVAWQRDNGVFATINRSQLNTLTS